MKQYDTEKAAGPAGLISTNHRGDTQTNTIALDYANSSKLLNFGNKIAKLVCF